MMEEMILPVVPGEAAVVGLILYLAVFVTLFVHAVRCAMRPHEVKKPEPSKKAA